MNAARHVMLGGAVGALLAALLLVTSQAPAHPATDWYEDKWRDTVVSGVQNDKRAEWRFTIGFASGDGSRDRTREAAYEWSSVQGSTMSFNFENGASDYAYLDFDTVTMTPPLTKKTRWVRETSALLVGASARR